MQKRKHMTRCNLRPVHLSISYFLLTILLLLVPIQQSLAKTTLQTTPTKRVLVGAEQVSTFLPLLKGKKVGLVVNQTSVTEQGHLLDVLLSHDIEVLMLFAPEHGVRGNKGAGEFVANSRDTKTGISIYSIYGANKKPPAEVLDKIDTLIFDIQDVGTRFYTYISSMHYMMESAAENDLEFIVLDRPNPNGQFIDGPILEPEFQSFVGMHPIPVLHGLTVGELALMIKGEKWINNAAALSLRVIPVQNYRKSDRYSIEIPPSPNLPNDEAIQLYPSLCFFEATPLSIGRGSDFPFQVLAHDKLDILSSLVTTKHAQPNVLNSNEGNLAKISFMPTSKPFAAPNPKFKNIMLNGVDFRRSKVQGLNLSILLQVYRAFDAQGLVLFSRPEFMDKLSGTNKLRKAIESNVSEEDIRKSWEKDLEAYKEMIKPYELYQR